MTPEDAKRAVEAELQSLESPDNAPMTLVEMTDFC